MDNGTFYLNPYRKNFFTSIFRYQHYPQSFTGYSTFLFFLAFSESELDFFRLNTFLLAEELRIKVVTEAFKRDPTIPEGFQWEPLSYQSVDDSSDQSKIKNLSHLKQASKLSNYQNSSNKENVKKHRNIENDMTVTGKFDGMTVLSLATSGRNFVCT